MHCGSDGRGVEGSAFLSVILSERSESKDPYSCEKSQCGTATNLGLLAAKGVPRLLAALVAPDDTQETSAIMDNPGEGPLYPSYSHYETALQRSCSCKRSTSRCRV